MNEEIRAMMRALLERMKQECQARDLSERTIASLMEEDPDAGRLVSLTIVLNALFEGEV